MTTTSYHHLPNDICRCHDNACPQREECLRWLCREQCEGRTPHVNTMRTRDQPEHCDMFLQKGTNAPTD